MNSCCFTYTSREGSILSAVCSIGGALLWLGQILYDIQQVNCQQPINIILSEVCQEDFSWYVFMITLKAVVPCLLLITGGVLLIGIAKNCARLLLPWLMLNTVSVSILAIGTFWSVLTVLASNISTSDLPSATFTFATRVGFYFMNIYCIYYVTSLYCEILNSKTMEGVPDANTVGIINCKKGKQLAHDKGDSLVDHIVDHSGPHIGLHSEPPPAYTAYPYTDLCSACSASVAARASLQGRIKE